MYPVINPQAATLAAELESCGVSITSREEVVERLQEAWNWRSALDTLVRNGARIHIIFSAPAAAFSAVCAVLLKNGFDSSAASNCARRICNQ